ncbi:MAG: lipoate--protein ligase family protein [Planctomycetota bacterium]|nr:MAG: lipoate--protein ligase family protein [Planctomycetota bacterium]
MGLGAWSNPGLLLGLFPTQCTIHCSPATRAGFRDCCSGLFRHDAPVETCFTEERSMHYVDLTLPTPAENLAWEDALLQQADSGQFRHECLRLWDARQVFVVLGRSSRARQEVHLETVDRQGIPLLRRITGGATIVAAPGCMFYAVTLSLEKRPELRMLDQAHRFVMERIRQAVGRLGIAARVDGNCDLVVGERKTSGNSLRIQRNWLLYHGTLLLDMDLSWPDRLLAHPPREPAYRRGRAHCDFLANLGVSRHALADALCHAWQAEPLAENAWPQLDLEPLIAVRYGSHAWNRSR